MKTNPLAIVLFFSLAAGALASPVESYLERKPLPDGAELFRMQIDLDGDGAAETLISDETRSFGEVRRWSVFRGSDPIAEDLLAGRHLYRAEGPDGPVFGFIIVDTEQTDGAPVNVIRLTAAGELRAESRELTAAENEVIFEREELVRGDGRIDETRAGTAIGLGEPLEVAVETARAEALRLDPDAWRAADHEAAQGGDLIFSLAPGIVDRDRPSDLGLPLIESARVRVVGPPFDWGHNLSTSLVHIDGRFVMTWNQTPEFENDDNKKAVIAFSEDGVTWTAPQVIHDVETFRGHPETALGKPGGRRMKMTNTLLTAIGGKLVLCQNLSHRESYLLTSDDGETWSEPEKLTDGFFQNPPMERDGRWFWVGQEPYGDWRPLALHSDTPLDPDSWRKGRLVGPLHEGVGKAWLEPSLWSRPDGAVVARLRANRSRDTLYGAVTRDNGDTWEVGPTNFPDAESKGASGNLPDGRAYIVNNPGERRNRSVLALFVSDDGVVFDRGYRIASHPPDVLNPGYGISPGLKGWMYPSTLVHDGDLYVAVSLNKEFIDIFRIPLENIE